MVTNYCASWKVATLAATGASDDEPAYEAGIRLVRGRWRGHRTAGIPSFTRAVGASALGPAAALVPHPTRGGARSSSVAVPCPQGHANPGAFRIARQAEDGRVE